MFRKFDYKEDVRGQNPVKGSLQKQIRSKMPEMFPMSEADIDEILPKKANWTLFKCRDAIQLIAINDEICLFNSFDGPWLPTLHLLHKYPNMMPVLQVDKGAIKFIIGGANIMCPGLTSKGAKMDINLPEKSYVAIRAEGKEHILSVGLLLMSTDDIKKINKGHGVENIHHLNDPLWKLNLANKDV